MPSAVRCIWQFLDISCRYLKLGKGDGLSQPGRLWQLWSHEALDRLWKAWAAV